METVPTPRQTGLASLVICCHLLLVLLLWHQSSESLPVAPSQPVLVRTVSVSELLPELKSEVRIESAEIEAAPEEAELADEMPEAVPEPEVLAQMEPDPVPEPVTTPKAEKKKPAPVPLPKVEQKKAVPLAEKQKPKTQPPKAKPKTKQMAKPMPKKAQPKVTPKKEAAKKPAAKKEAPKKRSSQLKAITDAQKKTPDPAAVARQQALLAAAKEKIAKIDLSNHNGTGAIALEAPSTIKSLRIDTTSSGSQESAGSADYYAQMVQRLRMSLRMPEDGDVKVRMTIDRSGRVTQVIVVSSVSQKNRDYVVRNLPDVRLPPLGAYFQGEKELTCTLVLSGTNT